MSSLTALLLPFAESRAIQAAIKEAQSDPATAKDLAVARAIIETIPARIEQPLKIGIVPSVIPLAYLHEKGAEFDPPDGTASLGYLEPSADVRCCYSRPWNSWFYPDPHPDWLGRVAKLVWQYCDEAGFRPRLDVLTNARDGRTKSLCIAIKLCRRRFDRDLYPAIYAGWVLEEVKLPQTLEDLRAGKAPSTGHIISREALRASIAFEIQHDHEFFWRGQPLPKPLPPVIQQLANDRQLAKRARPLRYLDKKYCHPTDRAQIAIDANYFLKRVPKAIAGFACSTFNSVDEQPFCSLMTLEKHHIAQELDLNKEALPENLRGAARVVWNQLIAIGLKPKLRAAYVDVFYPSGNYSLPGEINREPRFEIYMDWSDMSDAEPAK